MSFLARIPRGKKIPFSNHFPIFENLLELVVSWLSSFGPFISCIMPSSFQPHLKTCRLRFRFTTLYFIWHSWSRQNPSSSRSLLMPPTMVSKSRCTGSIVLLKLSKIRRRFAQSLPIISGCTSDVVLAALAGTVAFVFGGTRYLNLHGRVIFEIPKCRV